MENQAVADVPKSEKIKAKSLVVKKATDAYTIWEVLLEDGRKVQTFDKLAIGEEVFGIVSKDQYGLKFKKAKDKGKFPQKDYGFEKRRVALECAVNMANKQGLTSKAVLQVANEFHEFLNS